LLDDEHDHVAEVTCLLDLDVKTADRLGESLEKFTQLVAGVIGTDLILELDLRVEDGIEVRTQFAGSVRMLDDTTYPFDVRLRHRPSSISRRSAAFHAKHRFSSKAAVTRALLRSGVLGWPVAATA
jgi:hypothetical protein